MKQFASQANLLICSIVTLAGLFWLRKLSEDNDKPRYVFRAYFCWWLSWVAWAGAWSIITFTDWETTHPTWVLALSDLNAIFLITVYFSLTRGTAYKPVVAVIEFGYLCTVIGAGYGIFYFLLPERFLALQTGWGLCLSAVSTLLLGWAFVFRYKTRSVLIVGFIYAFSQPAAFDAVFSQGSTSTSFQDAFQVVLAILKILWATVVTLHFTQFPATEENIIVDAGKGALFAPLHKLPYAFFAQTLALIGLTAAFAIFVIVRKSPPSYSTHVLPILTGLSSLAAIVTLLSKFFSWLKDNATKSGSPMNIN